MPHVSSDRRLPLLITALLAGGWALRLAVVWDRLPAVVGTHLSARGTAEGGMSRGAFFFMDLAILAGVVFLLVAVLPRTPPSMLNLQLPAQWREPRHEAHLIERLRVWFAWLAALTTGLMLGMSELLIRANLGAAVPRGTVWAMLAGFVAGLAAWLVLFHRTFRRPSAEPPPVAPS